MNFDEFKEKIEKVRSMPIEIIDRENIPAEEISDFDKLPKNPDISVLTITYNHSPFIRQYLESVLNQKFDGTYEIVIGEDCSTDDTRDILIEYQKKYPEKIRIVYSEKNVGAISNLIRSAKKCRGKYIALIEGDDFWHSELKLAKQFAYMENHPECSACFSDSDELVARTGKTRKNIWRTKGILNKEIDFTTKFLLMNPDIYFTTCTAFAKADVVKNIFEQAPLFALRTMMGDTPLFLDLSTRGKVCLLPESLGTRRLNLPGTSASQHIDPAKKIDFRCDIWLVKYYYAINYLTDSELKEFNIKESSIFYLFSTCYLPKKTREFRSLLNALDIKPSGKNQIYLLMSKYRLLNWAGKIFRKLKGL